MIERLTGLWSALFVDHAENRGFSGGGPVRVVHLLVAALVGLALVTGAHATESSTRCEADRAHLASTAPATVFTHPDLGFAEEAKPCEPAVAHLWTTVRTAVAAPVAPTAARVDTRVARGPPGVR
ncbi:hypothetical protein J7S33_04510 [Saccharothrix algeriensis]|uniref:Uncharacterized protein n=1 Tax=Saccharothrix algeriensis TaxID=173560 RepID=A0A8T8I0A3_9PSEU|nr:hypothetical protein J7S33_04510 [Saccharothrix algeriensis]